jgi:hypothetical protein
LVEIGLKFGDKVLNPEEIVGEPWKFVAASLNRIIINSSPNMITN